MQPGYECFIQKGQYYDWGLQRHICFSHVGYHANHILQENIEKPVQRAPVSPRPI